MFKTFPTPAIAPGRWGSSLLGYSRVGCFSPLGYSRNVKTVGYTAGRMGSGITLSQGVKEVYLASQVGITVCTSLSGGYNGVY